MVRQTRQSWQDVLERVLRPARPELERCMRERERHVGELRGADQARAEAIKRCEARIESARAEVFAAMDGVVTERMTALERVWRTLSASTPDERVMDLWARVAPASWLDHKRWRDEEPAARLDAAVALASDVRGVEAAEAAVRALAAALAPFGVAVGERIRWRAHVRDFEGTEALLAKPLCAAREALAARDWALVALRRGEDVEREVFEAARDRLPTQPLLAEAVAHAALVDWVWGAAAFDPAASPVRPVRDLWTTGYVVVDVDDVSVTLGFAGL